MAVVVPAESQATEQVKPVSAQNRYIRLSGYVNLTGSGFANAHWPFITLNVSGTTQLRDDSGRFLGGSVYLSDTVSCHAPSNYVTCWARPSAYVSVYDNGRYLGSVRVDGNITVSGWKSGNWVHVNGSGQVSGTGYIQDPAPPLTRDDEGGTRR